jgi:hypothetical protein
VNINMLVLTNDLSSVLVNIFISGMRIWNPYYFEKNIAIYEYCILLVSFLFCFSLSSDDSEKYMAILHSFPCNNLYVFHRKPWHNEWMNKWTISKNKNNNGSSYIAHFTNVPMCFTISGGLFRAAYYGAMAIGDWMRLTTRKGHLHCKLVKYIISVCKRQPN